MKISRQTIILSTIAATLMHIGVAAITWHNHHQPQAIDVDDLVFVDLGSLQGDNQALNDDAPPPLPEQQPQPEKKVEKVIQTVQRPDKPADLIVPEKPKITPPKPKPPKANTPTITPPPEGEHRIDTTTTGNGSNNPANNQDSNGTGSKGSAEKPGRSGGKGGGVIDGGYVNLPMPSYPMRALEEGEQGKVLIEMIVEADGSVSSAKVYKSSGSQALDKAARLAAKSAKMKPKIVDGLPVRSRFIAPFDFKLTS